MGVEVVRSKFGPKESTSSSFGDDWISGKWTGLAHSIKILKNFIYSPKTEIFKKL